MRSGTRERIVAAGLELFQEFGFAQVGLDQILQQVGLTKTTFYNHFRGKEELVRATILQRENEVNQRLVEGVERIGGADPRARLLAVLDVLHEMFRENTGGRCLLLSAVVEFPNDQDPIHRLAIESRRQRREQFSRLATEAGVGDPTDFTRKFEMLVDAAIVGWHVGRDPSAAVAAKQIAEQLVDAARSGA